MTKFRTMKEANNKDSNPLVGYEHLTPFGQKKLAANFVIIKDILFKQFFCTRGGLGTSIKFQNDYFQLSLGG